MICQLELRIEEKDLSQYRGLMSPPQLRNCLRQRKGQKYLNSRLLPLLKISMPFTVSQDQTHRLHHPSARRTVTRSLQDGTLWFFPQVPINSMSWVLLGSMQRVVDAPEDQALLEMVL